MDRLTFLLYILSRDSACSVTLIAASSRSSQERRIFSDLGGKDHVYIVMVRSFINVLNLPLDIFILLYAPYSFQIARHPVHKAQIHANLSQPLPFPVPKQLPPLLPTRLLSIPTSSLPPSATPTNNPPFPQKAQYKSDAAPKSPPPAPTTP